MNNKDKSRKPWDERNGKDEKELIAILKNIKHLANLCKYAYQLWIFTDISNVKTSNRHQTDDDSCHHVKTTIQMCKKGACRFKSHIKKHWSLLTRWWTQLKHIKWTKNFNTRQTVFIWKHKRNSFCSLKKWHTAEVQVDIGTDEIEHYLTQLQQ